MKIKNNFPKVHKKLGIHISLSLGRKGRRIIESYAPSNSIILNLETDEFDTT